MSETTGGKTMTVGYFRADGRYPFAASILTHRNDPTKPNVINYRCASALVWGLTPDEAIGAGVRWGNKEWPMEDGWQSPSVAVLPLSMTDVEQIAAMVEPAPGPEGA
jgi:hypothetical protein